MSRYETYNPNVQSDGNIGAIGWAGLIGGIAVWDALAPQTLSAFVHKMNREHHTRPLVGLALGVTALHLMRPDSLRKYDPITQMGGFIRDHI